MTKWGEMAQLYADNQEWKHKHEQQLKKEKEKKMNKQKIHQDINPDAVRKLNEVNHDYQRMRKIAKKRISKRLSAGQRILKKNEVDTMRHLGIESLTTQKRTWRQRVVESSIWIAIGFLISLWLH